MKLHHKVILIVCGVAMLLGGVFAAINAVPTEYKNAGRVLFETDAEYSQFKRMLGTNQEIEISDMTILSSEPPIVVEFIIHRPANIDFPYGNAQPSSYEWGGLISCLCTAGIVSIVVGSVWIIPDKRGF